MFIWIYGLLCRLSQLYSFLLVAFSLHIYKDTHWSLVAYRWVNDEHGCCYGYCSLYSVHTLIPMELSAVFLYILCLVRTM